MYLFPIEHVHWKGQPLTCLRPLQWGLVLTLRLLMSYIYDISSLRVNDLTLILLTWRKRRAPNNACK